MRFRSGLLIGIFGLVVVLLGRWFFTLATALLTYLALLEFFRMAEFKGIKPATKTTLFSSFVIIICTYLETIGVLEGEISNSILPISSVGICTWLLLQPKPGTISDIAASIFGLFYLGFLPSYWIKLRELDSIKSPTNAIREIEIPYKIPTNKGFSQFIKNAKNIAIKIEQDIPPITPSIVLLGDIGESGVLPNDFPMK